MSLSQRRQSLGKSKARLAGIHMDTLIVLLMAAHLLVAIYAVWKSSKKQ